ncbi:MAG: RnfABCDGE type electron transport complex subunit D [Spirochaetota bacterium]
MSNQSEGFVLQTAPHAHGPSSVPRIMHAVNISLIPVIVISVLYFGLYVLGLYLIAIASCLATEALIKLIRKQSWRSILDGSGIVTALLLVMVLPPSISPLLVVIGSVVSIFIGKEVFGGIGQNVCNPALVGRAFLAAAYPVPLTTWTPAREVFGFLPSAQTLSMGADGVTGATPLAAARFEGTAEPLLRLFLGQTAGSIGATSVLAILIGGLALMAMGIVRWRMVVSFLGTIAVGTGVFWLIDPTTYASPAVHLLGGGAVFAAFYMVSDMVTTPYMNRGTIIFGVGAGALTVIIRLFGGFPEGVMYAILLMNAVTPIINRLNNPVFGSGKPEGRTAPKPTGPAPNPGGKSEGEKAGAAAGGAQKEAKA